MRVGGIEGGGGLIKRSLQLSKYLSSSVVDPQYGDVISSVIRFAEGGLLQSIKVVSESLGRVELPIDINIISARPNRYISHSQVLSSVDGNPSYLEVGNVQLRHGDVDVVVSSDGVMRGLSQGPVHDGDVVGHGEGGQSGELDNSLSFKKNII